MTEQKHKSMEQSKEFRSICIVEQGMYREQADSHLGVPDHVCVHSISGV